MDPNSLLADIHNRMPMTLSPEIGQIWLDRDARPSDLLPLLRPCPALPCPALPCRSDECLREISLPLSHLEGDLQMAGNTPWTIQQYLSSIRGFEAFLGRRWTRPRRMISGSG